MSDLALKIQTAILRGAASLGTLVSDATLSKLTTGSYDVSTGAVSTSSSMSSLRVVIDKYDSQELINTSIESTDLKVLAFFSAVVPTSGDTITVNTLVYKILKVSEHYVGSTVALYELQCRK